MYTSVGYGLNVCVLSVVLDNTLEVHVAPLQMSKLGVPSHITARLLAGLRFPVRSGPRSVRVRFVVNTVAVGWAVLPILRLSRIRIGKGKGHLRINHEGPGVELMYGFFFFNLGARWGGWSTPRLGRFTPGKDTVPIL
jgi:hypothetical protein